MNLSDRARLRRDYLRKTTIFHTSWYVGATIVLGIGSIGGVFIPLLLADGTINLHDPRHLAAVSGTVVLLIIGCRLTTFGHKLATTLSYVPSVREQVSALPVEEVLLRGS